MHINIKLRQILAVILILASLAPVTASAEKAFSPVTVENGELTANGEKIVLNGINLGNWLITESWMSPIYDPEEQLANADVTEILTRRFGRENTQRLTDIYQSSYITEADFDKIQALGFNCVRIPFWYRNFMNEDGSWLNISPDRISGFKRLDWAIEQCEKRGIYVVLDMHGCPGGQSTDHSTGTIGKCKLYTDSTAQKMMEKLWTAIARRYKHRNAVIAYDIMNEPQNNSRYGIGSAWQAETPQAIKQTNMIYKQMVKAIRVVDPQKVITVEGIWSMKVLPAPSQYGWKNMMYQLHIYDDTEEMIDFRIGELLSARASYGTAVYVGEYNHKGLDRYAVNRYKAERINRTRWTYKTVNADYDGWGLFNRNLTRVDLNTVSLEELEQLFGNEIITDNGFEFNTAVYDSIK